MYVSRIAATGMGHVLYGFAGVYLELWVMMTADAALRYGLMCPVLCIDFLLACSLDYG